MYQHGVCDGQAGRSLVTKNLVEAIVRVPGRGHVGVMAVRGVPRGVIMAGRGRVWHVHHKEPADPGSDELGLRSQACHKPNLEQTWSRQVGGQAGSRAAGQAGRIPGGHPRLYYATRVQAND